MIPQVGCHLLGITSPSEAFQELLRLPNLTSLFPEFQTFPGFFCIFPAPSIAVAFNNCCFTHTHTHTPREKTSPCQFLTHYSLHAPAQHTWGISQFRSLWLLLAPRSPASLAQVAALPGHAWWVGLRCLLPFRSLPPLIFSSHSLSGYYIHHFPG